MLYVVYNFQIDESIDGSGDAFIEMEAPRKICDIANMIRLIREQFPRYNSIIPINWKELEDD